MATLAKTIPKLRFPGFNDDWVQHKCGDLFVERNERGNDSLHILSVSIHSGISDGELDEESLGKIVRRSEDKSKYKHVYYGDLIFNMMRAWQGAIGVAKCEGMISPAYISAIPSKEVYPLFMDYALRRKDVIEEVNNLSYGVTDFRKRLYWDSFVNVNCSIPSIDEQKRIYTFLRCLDNLIDLHRRKCNEVKMFKFAMLKKMFPKNGATVPEIRFPGFVGDWEQRKFGDVGNISMCKRIFKEETSPEGEVPFYKIGTFGGKPDAYISKALYEDYKSKFSFPEKGAILLSASGTIGRIVEYTGEDAYFQDSNIVWLSHDNSVINKFLKTLYPTIQWDGIEGSTIKRLYNDNFLRTQFMMPSTDEQEKIGGFFESMDNLITLHQQKLDELKELKSAMLQKMFV